ncbi:MAG: hypothetical protein KC561_17770, partial [Myxococcales bacterium]|nr:hypothetical protein [Myxococcales bacterium]
GSSGCTILASIDVNDDSTFQMDDDGHVQGTLTVSDDATFGVDTLRVWSSGAFYFATSVDASVLTYDADGLLEMSGAGDIIVDEDFDADGVDSITNLLSGTLTVGRDSLFDTAAMTINGGTFDFNQTTAPYGSLIFRDDTVIQLISGSLESESGFQVAIADGGPATLDIDGGSVVVGGASAVSLKGVLDFSGGTWTGGTPTFQSATNYISDDARADFAGTVTVNNGRLEISVNDEAGTYAIHTPAGLFLAPYGALVMTAPTGGDDGGLFQVDSGFTLGAHGSLAMSDCNGARLQAASAVLAGRTGSEQELSVGDQCEVRIVGGISQFGSWGEYLIDTGGTWVSEGSTSQFVLGGIVDFDIRGSLSVEGTSSTALQLIFNPSLTVSGDVTVAGTVRQDGGTILLDTASSLITSTGADFDLRAGFFTVNAGRVDIFDELLVSGSNATLISDTAAPVDFDIQSGNVHVGPSPAFGTPTLTFSLGSPSTFDVNAARVFDGGTITMGSSGTPMAYAFQPA